MKKILPLSLIAFSSLLYADFSTQEFLYKDPRVMGMGAANTAVGGYSTAVFYNPAGLINIKKEHGWEVELLGVSVSSSKDVKSFADDIKDADTDQEVSDVVKKYSGDAFNITASNYTSVSYHTEDDLALSIGVLISTDTNFIPHANSGANGLVETHSRGYGGVILGAAQTFRDVVPGKLTVGVGAKYITQKSYEAALDAGEISAHSDDLMGYLQDTYEVDNSGFGIDLGLLYEPNISSDVDSWHPTFGLSVMNIGTLNFDDAYGAQPMTVNAGISVSPEVSFLNSFSMAVDYVDMFNAQQARVVDYVGGTPKDLYTNADVDFDVMQHIRAGVKAGLFDNSWAMMTLSGGLYQGAYTAGLDLQLTVLKIQLATYQEQLGAKTGQLEDRRYVLGLGIGW